MNNEYSIDKQEAEIIDNILISRFDKFLETLKDKTAVKPNMEPLKEIYGATDNGMLCNFYHFFVAGLLSGMELANTMTDISEEENKTIKNEPEITAHIEYLQRKAEEEP